MKKQTATDEHDDFGGLDRDLPQLLGRNLGRRQMLMAGGTGLLGLLVTACAGSTNVSSPSSSPSTSSPTSVTATTPTTIDSTTPGTVAASTTEATSGAAINDETAGPYPADGSNGPNVLGTDGLLRADMTTSFGEYSGTAEGIPLTFNLTVVDATTGMPLPDHALYLWHCTTEGAYSLYEVTDQNYLRALQVTDSAGQVSFISVFPGCYAGRWPHAHFEVYDTTNVSDGSAAVKTSQLALPQAQCESVYTDSRYANSSGNLNRLSLDSDNVFADGWTDQLATITGDNNSGYTANLLIRI